MVPMMGEADSQVPIWSYRVNLDKRVRNDQSTAADQRCIGVDQAAVNVNLASIDQPGANTLCHYPTKERHEHVLTPSFPCFA